MIACAECGRAITGRDRDGALRSDRGVFHLGCAPTALVTAASEEHRAIVRKGVRYFVEKYSVTSGTAEEVPARFIALGRAVDAERARRR